MNISNRGLAFVLDWEGFRPYLYNDGPAGGNATVAIGILVHLGAYHPARGVCALCDAWPRKWEPEKWLTEEQGRALFLEKATATGQFTGGQNYVGAVNLHFPDATQNQFDAMVSFAYNVGTGHLATMAAVYYSGGSVCVELRKYILPAWASEGLLRRRNAECALFMFNEPVEDEMKPYIAWVIGWGVFFIGPGGAHYVPKQQTVDELAVLYGINAAPSVGMSPDAARALGGS